MSYVTVCVVFALIKRTKLFSRGDDNEDTAYTMSEIADYEKRKQCSKDIDSQYVRSTPSRDIYNTQLEAERQVYGEVGIIIFIPSIIIFIPSIFLAIS